MRKLIVLFALVLLGAIPAFGGPDPDPRVERIKAELAHQPVFAQTISKLQIADFLGVTSATAGCAPSGQARAFYDPNLNQFKVLDSSCNLVIASGGTAWNTLLNPNGNATPNFGGTTFTFSNGNWDWGTLNLFVPGTPGFSPSSTRQLGFDTTAGNLLFNNGAPAYVPLLPTANAVNPGDLASFQISGGGQLTLASASVNSNTGTSTVQITVTNPVLGDSPCITALGPPLVFDNCTPGVPINLQSGTTYTYDGVSDRGTAVVSANANPQTYTLPLISEDNNTAADFFLFQLGKGPGTVTLTLTSPNTFDSTGTQTESLFQGENVTLLSDPASGIVYPKFSPGRVSVTSPIVASRSNYGVALSCPTCSTSGGSLTSGKVPVASGASTLVDSSTLDDNTNPARNDHGFDVNTVGRLQYWIANNTGTGTTLNKMVCDDGAGKGIICNHTTTATNNPLGVAKAANGAAGPGTSGSTGVCNIGFCTVIMDNTATANHFAQMSTSVDGDLSDVGTSAPTNGLPYWSIVVGNSGVGTAATFRNMSSSELNKSGGGNAKGQLHGISFTIGDPAGSALTAASTTTDYIADIPFACTITSYALALAPSGTITVKFWKVAGGTAIPTSGNSINTSGVQISSGTRVKSTSLGDFTTLAVAAGDQIAMNVTAVATASFINGVLGCQE